jgi:hypothetical protein
MHFEVIFLALMAILAFTAAQSDSGDSDLSAFDNVDGDEIAARGITEILGKPGLKIHNHHHHKHQKHHKHHHHKVHLGKKKPNSQVKHAHPLGDGFCCLPGSPCLGGNRDACAQ